MLESRELKLFLVFFFYLYVMRTMHDALATVAVRPETLRVERCRRALEAQQELIRKQMRRIEQASLGQQAERSVTTQKQLAEERAMLLVLLDERMDLVSELKVATEDLKAMIALHGAFIFSVARSSE